MSSSAMGGPSRQYALFPRKALAEHPKATASADSLGSVEADDNHIYFTKGDAHGRLVRASEWICTHVAETVGITAPTPCIIELTDGSTVFGSRKVHGLADEAVTLAFLCTPSQSNTATPLIGLRTVLSSIYAFDMFMFNDDRHPGNYMSVDDGGMRRLYTFDFSRALFWHWPWNGYPSEGSNTIQVGRFLRAQHGFDQVAAATTLDRLESVPVQMINGFINLMPTDWLPAKERDELLSWWGADPPSRADALRQGFADGSAL
jgi:hypothetical protein